MKKFRRILSFVLVVALLAGFALLPGHAATPKSFEPGDINGDGKVNVGDVSRLYSHIRGVRLITEEDALSRADLTGDGKIKIGDTARVYALVRSTVPNKTKATLKVWAPAMAMVEEGWILQMEEAFAKANPKYSITWINEVCGEGDAGYMVSRDPAAAADVYFFANDQMGTLVSVGALASLEGDQETQVKNDNTQSMVGTVTFTDGKIYGFPVSNNTWFMYYDKNVFTEEDVKSLDAMLQKGRVAFDWGNAWYSGSFFLANGGQIFGPQGVDAAAGVQFGVNNGGYDAAMKMVQLANNPNMIDGGSISGSAFMDFLYGYVDAYFSGSWDYEYLYEQLGDRLGAVQPPMVEINGQQKQMKAFAGSKAVGVNPQGSNPAVASEFAAFLASVDSQKLRYELDGTIPAATALANDPAISSNMVAMAELNTMRNAAVPQPYLAEMSNYWNPVGTFGGMVSGGAIDPTNVPQAVDQLMYELNNFDPGEPDEPLPPVDPWEPVEPEGEDILLPPNSTGTPITLKVWTGDEDQQNNGNWLVRMENQFQLAHPEYSITWINEICSEADAGWVVTENPEAAADVFLFANDQLGMLKGVNALTVLEDRYLAQVMEDNSQTLVNTVTYYLDEQVYGFPVGNNTWFMYYDKSIFTEEDVKSLDTMLQKGKVALDWSNGWYGGTFFLANGGKIFGDKGIDAAAGIQFGANNGGYEAALKMVQLAENPNLVTDGYGYGLFTEGTVGAFFSGSWDYASLYEQLGDRLGAVQLPMVEINGQEKQMKAFAGSKAVGVNGYSANQAVAMEFASHLASTESQKLRYLLNGAIPAAKALANDPEVSSNPAALAEINTMTNASVMQPVIDEMSNYWSPVGNFGGMVTYGEINLSNYQEAVDNLMREFGFESVQEEEY